MNIKSIVKFVIKAFTFVCKSVKVDSDSDGNTRISLNINSLLERVIYACVQPFIAK